MDTGSTVSSAAKIDKELRTTLGKASAAYGKLHQILQNNRQASIRVKSRVYRAVVLSNLLYKAESWTIHTGHKSETSAFCEHTTDGYEDS